MSWLLVTLIVSIALAAGALGGALMAVLGGTGVLRSHTRELRVLHDDIEAVDARLTRDQNRRSAIESQKVRDEKRTDAQLKAEAAQRLAETGPVAKNVEPLVPGFNSMFKKNG